MVGVVLDFPLAHGSGHDVEVLEIVAGRRGDRVVAPRNENRIPVEYGHRLIEGALLVVDPLHGETLLWLYRVVVGLLQVGLVRAVVPIMPVWRVAVWRVT